MSVVKFEVSCRFELRFIYLVVEIGEVFAVFLKCYSVISNEVGCQESRMGRGQEICCFGDVEG
jgi:hypothetical protein